MLLQLLQCFSRVKVNFIIPWLWLLRVVVFYYTLVSLWLELIHPSALVVNKWLLDIKVYTIEKFQLDQLFCIIIWVDLNGFALGKVSLHYYRVLYLAFLTNLLNQTGKWCLLTDVELKWLEMLFSNKRNIRSPQINFNRNLFGVILFKNLLIGFSLYSYINSLPKP